MSNGHSSGDVAEIVSEIRNFVASVEEPQRWTVTVPVESFDGVKQRLDTESDAGTFYEGVRLCYSPHHDDTRVKCTVNLSEYNRSLQLESYQEDSHE